LKARLRRLEESIESSNKNVKELNESFAAAHAQDSKINKMVEKKEDDNEKIAILVITCNRPYAAESHIKQLIEMREKSGKVEKFPIIVSQDCDHDETANAIEKYREHLFAFVKVREQS
jgi:hypothetical protein